MLFHFPELEIQIITRIPWEERATAQANLDDW